MGESGAKTFGVSKSGERKGEHLRTRNITIKFYTITRDKNENSNSEK